MYNLPDEEFDRLCREAAEDPTAQVPVQGWEGMRQRLDREMPEDKGRRRAWPFWIPFLLFVPVSLFVWKNQAGEPLQASVLSSVHQETGNRHTAQEATGQIASVRPNPSATGVGIAAEDKVNKMSIPEKPLSTHRSVSDGLNIGSSPASHAAAPGAAATLATEKESSNPAQASETAATSSAPQQQSAPEAKEEAQQKLPAPAKPVSTAERGLGFGLVLGPDWSNVRFAAPDKMGFNAGITVQYRFNKRWVLQTGLMYSQKHYTVGDAMYPGYNTSNPSFKMTRVQANCFMWDIPVNLRFDALSTQRHKAYLAAGISSYLMSREDLHYYYTWNNIPRYKGLVNEKDNMYGLSEFNFAIGYERALSREWSVRLEPFIKLPISSVGTGKVDLISLGALAGITYTPLRLFKPTLKK